MQRFLFFLVLFLSLTPLLSQTHNVNCMRCKYSKYNLEKNRAPVKGRALNECGCVACGEKSKKEQAARQAEEKKRVDALIAKQKAEYEAKEKAFAAEQQRKREEIARKKEQEEKDRIAREALMRKYREMADKGKVKVKESAAVETAEIDLKIQPFVNDRDKTYGFKVDTIIVFKKAFTEPTCWLNQIDNSKYFSLQLYDQTSNKLRCFLLNMYGEEIAIDGIKEFSLMTWPKNQIHLYKDKTEPEFVRNWADVDYRSNMYSDKSSAITEITRPRSGYSFGCEDNYVVPATQYVLNLALEIEQQIEGYRIFAASARCTN